MTHSLAKLLKLRQHLAALHSDYGPPPRNRTPQEKGFPRTRKRSLRQINGQSAGRQRDQLSSIRTDARGLLCHSSRHHFRHREHKRAARLVMDIGPTVFALFALAVASLTLSIPVPPQPQQLNDLEAQPARNETQADSGALGTRGQA